MNSIRTALIITAVLLASTPALAQGLYIGGSAGQSSIDVDVASFSGEDTAFKVFGGYRFNDYIAIEVFYTDFGAPDDAPLGIDVTAYGAEAVGIIPIGNRLEVFGKVGMAAWDADFTGPGGFGDDGMDLVYGAGLAIKIIEWVSIRGEWEFYQIETDFGGFDVDTEMLSAGVVFTF